MPGGGAAGAHRGQPAGLALDGGHRPGAARPVSAKYYRRSYDALPRLARARAAAARRADRRADPGARRLQRGLPRRPPGRGPRAGAGLHRGRRGAARGEPGRAVGLAAARGVELPARRPCPRPGHGVDDTAPDATSARSPSCSASRRTCGRACCSRRPTTPARRSGRRRANRWRPCSTSTAGSRPSSRARVVRRRCCDVHHSFVAAPRPRSVCVSGVRVEFGRHPSRVAPLGRCADRDDDDAGLPAHHPLGRRGLLPARLSSGR